MSWLKKLIHISGDGDVPYLAQQPRTQQRVQGHPLASSSDGLLPRNLLTAASSSASGSCLPLIAINKIHRTRLTIHTPYRDYHTLAKVCEQLEVDYHLQKDNHVATKCGAENRAADMEAHAGVESLLGWIRRECGEQIREAKTWGELHEVLSNHKQPAIGAER
jgi:hypothetical protein